MGLPCIKIGISDRNENGRKPTNRILFWSHDINSRLKTAKSKIPSIAYLLRGEQCINIVISDRNKNDPVPTNHFVFSNFLTLFREKIAKVSL